MCRSLGLTRPSVCMQSGEDDEQIQIRASVDFGENWCNWIDIDIDGAVSYIEGIVNFMERGKQVRLELRNVDGSNINIESIVIGYNDMKEKK